MTTKGRMNTLSTNKELGTFNFAPVVENLQKYTTNYSETLGF